MEKKQKKPLLKETGREIKTVFSIFAGVGFLRYFWSSIRQSNHAIWKKKDTAYWAASLGEEQRALLGKKVLLEGMLYGAVGMILGFSSVIESAQSRSLLSLFFWLVLGLLAFLISFGVLFVDLWKRHVLITLKPVPFWDWFLQKETEETEE